MLLDGMEYLFAKLCFECFKYMITKDDMLGVLKKEIAKAESDFYNTSDEKREEKEHHFLLIQNYNELQKLCFRCCRAKDIFRHLSQGLVVSAETKCFQKSNEPEKAGKIEEIEIVS